MGIRGFEIVMGGSRSWRKEEVESWKPYYDGDTHWMAMAGRLTHLLIAPGEIIRAERV